MGLLGVCTRWRPPRPGAAVPAGHERVRPPAAQGGGAVRRLPAGADRGHHRLVRLLRHLLPEVQHLQRGHLLAGPDHHPGAGRPA
ncbi:unnamed protein product, partial [Heterosigma akashiwo]